MFPPPASSGPPPPELRPPGMPEETPPMPPSMMAAQGAQQQKKPDQGDELGKKTLDLTMQNMVELRNVVKKLVDGFQAVDPEAIPILMEIANMGKALEQRVMAASSRGQSEQPSMAGMGPQSGAPPMPQPGGPPAGASATGM